MLKTDLDIRPVFHQSDRNCLAHINLGVLAYQVVSTIRYQLKAKDINLDWRNIVRTMNTQKEVTSTMQNKKGETVTIKKCSEPTQAVKEIYAALSYRPHPYFQKSVLPENGIREIGNFEIQIDTS